MYRTPELLLLIFLPFCATRMEGSRGPTSIEYDSFERVASDMGLHYLFIMGRVRLVHAVATRGRETSNL